MYKASHTWGLLGLLVLALSALLASVLIGSVDIPWATAARALFNSGDELTRSVILQLRLPRALSAFAVGGLLALAGVLLQALFRNPLADPFVLGVSGGAAVGALAGMLLGVSWSGLHLFAGGGALGIALLTFALGRGGGMLRLLLTGVLLASTCGALTSIMLAVADNAQMRGMVFWLAGDLSWAQYPAAYLLIVMLASVATLLFGRTLNVLASGETRSASLGLATQGARLLVFAAAAALTGMAVLSAGPVGFVGLVAPHVVRLAFATSDHRVVAPAAALCGGTLVCVADVLSRSLAPPRQLPIGAVMALLGTPMFLWLLRRSARTGYGHG
jgi:iron complex transport system permease protein